MPFVHCVELLAKATFRHENFDYVRIVPLDCPESGAAFVARHLDILITDLLPANPMGV